MARKTTKICSLMLSQHDDHRNAILTNRETTDKEKVLQLQAINSMIESLLMKSNCYQGFKYIDKEGLDLAKSMLGPDEYSKIFDSVPENNRMYFGLRDW